MEKEEYLHRLGANIVKLRKRKKWNQAELARNCDKDKQSIERLENGKINPSAFYLHQVATGLNTTVKELFDFE